MSRVIARNANKLSSTMTFEMIRSSWRTNSIFRYLLVGMWNALFSVILLYVLFYMFSSKYYEYELGINFILSTVQSYTTQRVFVWSSSGSRKLEFPRFFAATSAQYALNAIALFLAVHFFKLQPKYAALPIMLSVTCCFYFVNRNLVFKRKVSQDEKKRTDPL